MKASIRKKAILLIIATFITLIFLAPNLWMLFGSFKSQNAMFALPQYGYLISHISKTLLLCYLRVTLIY